MVSHNKTQCSICDNSLQGKQVKYCSKQCKSKAHNHSYPQQQKRGLARKLQAISEKGGCCQLCGYNKCIASLSFHHRHSSDKSFPLDVRNFSNRSMESIKSELNKCDLLCLNCHQELHWNETN